MNKPNYKKNITTLKAFIPDNKYIIDLITFCQLKNTDDWTKWVDNFNNILIIDRKTKYISIKLNQNINLQTTEYKDLYCKSNIKTLSSMNKYSVISIYNNLYYIWMLDHNNILRLCMYVDDILIENKPILNSGIKNLAKIIANVNIETWQEVRSIIEPLGIDEMKSWATKWPPQNDLLKLLPDIIKKDCDLV